MINISEMSMADRITLAKSFLAHIGGNDSISRDNFDLFIIDNGLAEDPGTDDRNSAMHKGFVQQRSNARRTISNCGAKLDDDAFTIVFEKSDPMNYKIKRWEKAMYAETADIANKIDVYQRNKVKRVGKMRRELADRADFIEPEEYEKLTHMTGLVEGHALIMERNIRGELNKFNRAIELVEDATTKVLEDVRKKVEEDEAAERERIFNEVSREKAALTHQSEA